MSKQDKKITSISKDRKTIKWLALFLILEIFLFLLVFLNKQEGDILESYTVQSMEIPNSITLSGRLQPQTSIVLSFNEGGALAKLYTDEGEQVKKGQRVAELSLEIIEAQKNKAISTIKTEQAIMSELRAGTRKEEIAEQQAVYDLTKLQQKHLLKSLISALKDAENDTINAIRNTIDDFFTSTNSSNPQLSFDLENNQKLELEIEFERSKINITLEKLINLGKEIELITFDSYERITEEYLDLLGKIRSFLSLSALVINSAEETQNASDTLIRTWKTNIASEITKISSNMTELQNTEQGIKEGELKIAQTELLLAKLTNGTTEEKIKTQEAKIDQAKSELAILEAQVKNRIIESPIDGLVADISKKIGESVTTQDPIATIISSNTFEVKLEVPELNVTSLNLDDRAIVSFAAIPEKEFFGKVSSIKAIPTTDTNLVPFYDVRVNIEDGTEHLRSGLIADVSVLTEEKQKEVLIPNRFIDYENQNGETFVKIKNQDGLFTKKPVIVSGYRDGSRAIIDSGLEGGEIIIIRE